MKKNKFITNCSRCGNYYDLDDFYVMAVDGKLSVRLCSDCYKKFKAFMDEYNEEDDEKNGMCRKSGNLIKGQ